MAEKEKQQPAQELIVLEPGKDIEKVRVADAVLEKMRKKYLPLKIKDADDKEGFERVHAARMDVKNTRIEVEKKRKELTEPYLRMQRDIKAIADGYIMQLSDIEAPLQKQEDWYKEEQERIKREKEAEEQRILQGRVARLIENGMKFDGAQYILNDLTIDSVQLKKLSEDAFEEFLSEVITLWEAEKEKIEKEKKAQEEAQKAREKEMEEMRKQLEEAEKVKQELEELKKAQEAAREKEKDIPAEKNEREVLKKSEFPPNKIREWHTTHDPAVLLKKFLRSLQEDKGEKWINEWSAAWQEWIKKENIFY